MEDLTSLWRLRSPPPPLFLPRISLRSLQRFAERSEMREAAALHSSGLTENNSTGCPALRSMHRRSSDVSPPRTHTRTHPLRPSSLSHSSHPNTASPGIISQMFQFPGRLIYPLYFLEFFFFLDKTVVCDEFYLKYFNKDLTDQLRKSRWNVAFRHH